MTDAVSAEAAHRERILTPAFLLVALATLAFFIAEGITLPITPRFAEGPLGADPFAVGLAIGAFSVSAILLRPWIGGIADRRGRRILAIAGAALFAVGMLGHLVAVNLALLVLMRLILGAAGALFFVGTLTAISDLAPESRRGEAISFFTLALYLGIGVGSVLGEMVLGGEGRFALVWLVAAATAGLAAILALCVSETHVIDASTPRAPRRLIHPAGVLPGLVLLCAGAAMAGYLAFVPLHSLAIGEEGAGLYLAVFSGVVVAARIVGARLPDRLGARRLSTTSMIGSALGLVIVFLLPTPTGLLLGTLVFSLGVAFTFPALSALAIAGLPASERGAAIGTFSAFLDIAFGLGPVVFGAVAAATGYAGAFGFGAVVLVAGAAVLMVGTRRRAV